MEIITTDNYTLYNGNCLEVIPMLNQVDAVITDPPYFNSKYSGTWATCDADSKRENHQWVDDYAWIMKTKLRKGGQWYIFTGSEGVTPLFNAAKLAGWNMLRMLVWIKTNPRPSIPRKLYRQANELCLWGSTGRAPSYFGAKDQKEALPYFMYPIVGGKERTKHPTQKPLKLITKFVEIGCQPDGIVLDPFMGSGTTGVACINTGRKFIGIEKDEEYFNIAKQRILSTPIQLTLNIK